MKLTGKAKEDFEKWYESLEDLYHLDIMPANMVFGVIVDWADSVGYLLKAEYFKGEYYYSVTIKNSIKSGVSGYEKTRHEAREKAIEKLNEIYNEKQTL